MTTDKKLSAVGALIADGARPFRWKGGFDSYLVDRDLVDSLKDLFGIKPKPCAVRELIEAASTIALPCRRVVNLGWIGRTIVQHLTKTKDGYSLITVKPEDLERLRRAIEDINGQLKTPKGGSDGDR